MERSDFGPARRLARAAGTVYVAFFLTALGGATLAGQAGVSALQTPTDPARMANTFVTHEALFEIGFALTLLSTACYVAVTALLYRLFRSVNAGLALVAALFSVMGQAVQTVGTVFQLAPLVLLGSNPSLAGFDATQLQSLALMLLNLGTGFGHVGLVFDGLWLMLLGYLIFRSALLPRALGVLVSAAGLGWEVYLVPPLLPHLQVPVEVLGFVAEAALMVWLIVVGVDTRRRDRAGAGRAANVASV